MHRLGFAGFFARVAALSLAVFSGHTVAAGSAVAELTAVSLQKHDAGTFYISGSIDGFGDLRMLVDTGSSFVVISEAILSELKKANAARYSRDLQGVMADGSMRIIPMYHLAGLRLGESCWIHNVEAAVFPGQTRAILGMNILARLAPFTFSAEPPELGLMRCQGKPPTPAEFTAVEAQHREGDKSKGSGQ